MINNIIPFIFNIINFALLISFAWYYFIKNIKNTITTKIKEKKIFWNNLINNHKILLYEQQKVDTEIIKQKEFADDLLKKVQLWNTIETKNQQFIEEQKNQYFEHKKIRSEKIDFFIEKNHLIKNIINPAFNNINQELYNNFKKEENITLYMESIFTTLKKMDTV